LQVTTRSERDADKPALTSPEILAASLSASMHTFQLTLVPMF
jgi:hypothetical protein